MNIQPTLEIHPHQEFHFAENTDTSWSCCCGKSKATRPKEYTIDDQYVFVPKKKASQSERIESNRRLSQLLKEKFVDDPIENKKAFRELKKRLNFNLKNGDPITDRKLRVIVNEMYKLKEEYKN